MQFIYATNYYHVSTIFQFFELTTEVRLYTETFNMTRAGVGEGGPLVLEERNETIEVGRKNPFTSKTVVHSEIIQQCEESVCLSREHTYLCLWKMYVFL